VACGHGLILRGVIKVYTAILRASHVIQECELFAYTL